jgi:hypothetical protein
MAERAKSPRELTSICSRAALRAQTVHDPSHEHPSIRSAPERALRLRLQHTCARAGRFDAGRARRRRLGPRRDGHGRRGCLRRELDPRQRRAGQLRGRRCHCDGHRRAGQRERRRRRVRDERRDLQRHGQPLLRGPRVHGARRHRRPRVRRPHVSSHGRSVRRDAPVLPVVRVRRSARPRDVLADPVTKITARRASRR